MTGRMLGYPCHEPGTTWVGAASRLGDPGTLPFSVATKVVAGTEGAELLGPPEGPAAARGASASVVAVVRSGVDWPGGVVASVVGGPQPELAVSERADVSEPEAGGDANDDAKLLMVTTKQLVATRPANVSQ